MEQLIASLQDQINEAKEHQDTSFRLMGETDYANPEHFQHVKNYQYWTGKLVALRSVNFQLRASLIKLVHATEVG